MRDIGWDRMIEEDSNNLFKVLKGSSSRKPENFSSEAFACLLRNYRRDQPGALREVLGVLAGSSFWKGVTSGSISIKTQVPTKEGRPDIEIIAPGRRVFVEVKDTSGTHSGQLRGYAKELDRIEGRKMLVLLSGYHSEPNPVHVERAVRRRWDQVADTLDGILKKGLLRNCVSRFLTKQFGEYLREEGLAMNKVRSNLIPGVRSFVNLLDMIRDAIEKCQKKPRASDQYDWVGFYIDGGRMWVGLAYGDPSVIRFETCGLRVHPGKAKLLHKGHIEDDSRARGGSKWVYEVNLERRHGRFFKLSPCGQSRFVLRFLKDSLVCLDRIRWRNR